MASRIQTIILLTSLMTLSGVEAIAQKSSSANTSGNGELVNSLLAPMTEQLKLTPEQQRL